MWTPKIKCCAQCLSRANTFMRLTCLTVYLAHRYWLLSMHTTKGEMQRETRKKDKQILLLFVIFMIVLTIKSMQRSFIQWKLFKVCSFIGFVLSLFIFSSVWRRVNMSKRCDFNKAKEIHSKNENSNWKWTTSVFLCVYWICNTIWTRSNEVQTQQKLQKKPR